MAKHKKIIIGLLVIPLMVSIFYIYSQLRNPLQQQPSIVTEPDIPNFTRGSFEIVTTFKEGDFKFPNQMPLLTISDKNPYTDPEIRAKAQTLGFDTEPKIVQDVRQGTTYIWNSPTASLVAYVKTRTLNYNLNNTRQAIDQKLSNEAFANIAQEFLAQRLLLDTSNLGFSSIVFLDQSEEFVNTVEKESATVVQVNFTFRDSQTQVLTLDPDSTPYTVKMLKDGSVASALVVDLGKVSTSQEVYQLKNYSEFISSLPSAKLVATNDGENNPYLLTQGLVQKVTVSEIELAYLMDSANTKILHPVFLLKGQATIKDVVGEVEATLYLPALSEN